MQAVGRNFRSSDPIVLLSISGLTGAGLTRCGFSRRERSREKNAQKQPRQHITTQHENDVRRFCLAESAASERASSELLNVIGRYHETNTPDCVFPSLHKPRSREEHCSCASF